ncbi:MAG TPA: RluA family pseudouridine synthase [Bacteroidales bacterium]|nr:RluA family pseudouridine synthase [Bacteroidales bacterium]
MHKNDTILKVDENIELMPFLFLKFPGKNRDNIKSLLRNKQVWINNKSVSQFNHKLVKDQEVVIRWARESDLPPDKYLNIVFEDDYLIVIEKKPGLLSVSDGHEHITAHAILTDWVKKTNESARVYIVHRLDQYTSGLLMFTKTEEVQNIFRENWKSYINERVYTAVVEGEVRRNQGTISSYLSENKALVMISGKDPSKGKLAITKYNVLEKNQRYSLVQLQLETGRKNQIRVHMQDIGHSVAGDRKYGARSNPVGRLCLHATVLALKHPVTGESLKFESKIPAEFLKLFAR